MCSGDCNLENTVNIYSWTMTGHKAVVVLWWEWPLPDDSNPVVLSPRGCLVCRARRARVDTWVWWYVDVTTLSGLTFPTQRSDASHPLSAPRDLLDSKVPLDLKDPLVDRFVPQFIGLVVFRFCMQLFSEHSSVFVLPLRCCTGSEWATWDDRTTRRGRREGQYIPLLFPFNMLVWMSTCIDYV